MPKINDPTSGDTSGIVIPALTEVPPPPPPVTGGDTSGATTIARSDKTVPTIAPDATNPILPSPSTAAMIIMANTAAELRQDIVTRLFQIENTMVDTWLKGIQEQAQRQEAEDARHALLRDTPNDLAKRKAEEDALVQQAQLSSTAQHAALVNAAPPMAGITNVPPADSIVLGMDKYLDRLGQNDPAAVAALPFMAVAFANMTTPKETVEVLGVSSNQPFAQVWQHAAVSTMPGDMRAELGLLGTFFATSLYQYTRLETLGMAKSTDGNSTINLQFAQNYAKNTIALVSGDELIPFVNAMIIGRMQAGGQIPNDLRSPQLVSQAKVALLALSLALMYKVQNRTISDEEIAALRNGTIPTTADPTSATLIGLIHANLKDLSAKGRSEILQGLTAYFDSDPSLEELADPKVALARIYKYFIPDSPIEA